MQVTALSIEARQVLSRHRPETLGHASRITGITPAAISLLMVHRAFASLPDFVRLTRPLLAPAGAWMAMKGKRPDDEIAALPPGVQVQAVEPLQVPGLEAERCLLWLVPTAAP
jgi:16S rRNA (guanine527-N7)-methyltransferase